MTKQQYTPGPWQFMLDGFYINNSTGECIAEIYGWGDLRDANANLIAAAPDLLEALKKVADHFRESGFEKTLNLIDPIIAKAEGRQ